MADQTVSAASNPALVNNLAAQATSEQAQPVQPAEITSPNDTLVTLPGGYVTAEGEVIKDVEVRELNGLDEEIIAKAPSMGRAFSAIISRATVRIGSTTATEEMLDKMLAGDRDAIMLGIYRATFGDKAELQGLCVPCGKYHSVEADVTKDLKTIPLGDPLGGRRFTVIGKGHEYTVNLPNGVAQKEIYNNTEKTGPELTTILLENVVTEIDGVPVFGKSQVKSIGMADRRLIGKELADRTFGPQFDPITVACPDCGEEMEVPINLGDLFRI
jgi:hypothetical protein